MKIKLGTFVIKLVFKDFERGNQSYNQTNQINRYPWDDLIKKIGLVNIHQSVGCEYCDIGLKKNI